MTAQIHRRKFFLGAGTPEEKHDVFLVLGNSVNHGIGKGFPSYVGVGLWLAFFHRENGIQQENALASPGKKTSVGWRLQAEVAFQFLENILERWWLRDTWQNRKTQAMGLSRAMVRVLSQDHHPQPVPRCFAKRGEQIGLRRIDTGALGSSFFHKSERLPKRSLMFEIANDVGPILCHES